VTERIVHFWGLEDTYWLILQGKTNLETLAGGDRRLNREITSVRWALKGSRITKVNVDVKYLEPHCSTT